MLTAIKESKERVILQSFTHSFNKHLLSTYLPDAMLGTGYMKTNKPQGKEMNCYLYYVSQHTQEFSIQNLSLSLQFLQNIGNQVLSASSTLHMLINLPEVASLGKSEINTEQYTKNHPYILTCCRLHIKKYTWRKSLGWTFELKLQLY